jgi:hypothetical protein
VVPPAALFEIGITYCDNVNFSHEHTTVKEATTEYTDLLRAAIEPDAYPLNARHVRMVSMMIYDEIGNMTRHVDSGVFPCVHRPEATDDRVAGRA